MLAENLVAINENLMMILFCWFAWLVNVTLMSSCSIGFGMFAMHLHFHFSFPFLPNLLNIYLKEEKTKKNLFWIDTQIQAVIKMR